jgi:hypothetical protein
VFGAARMQSQQFATPIVLDRRTAHRGAVAPSTSTHGGPLKPDDPLSSEAATTAASSVAPPPSLPKLKPIHRKPFPEDVPQAVLCEAINSTEPDLWVRFGHLLPLYMRGAIYVLQADASKEAVIRHFVTDDYARPHFPQLASCADKALLYVSNIFEESMFGNKPFGRLHLARELERRLGVKTLESFMMEDGDGNARRSDYCRQDGEVCDAIKSRHRHLRPHRTGTQAPRRSRISCCRTSMSSRTEKRAGVRGVCPNIAPRARGVLGTNFQGIESQGIAPDLSFGCPSVVETACLPILCSRFLTKSRNNRPGPLAFDGTTRDACAPFDSGLPSPYTSRRMKQVKVWMWKGNTVVDASFKRNKTSMTSTPSTLCALTTSFSWNVPL